MSRLKSTFMPRAVAFSRVAAGMFRARIWVWPDHPNLSARSAAGLRAKALALTGASTLVPSTSGPPFAACDAAVKSLCGALLLLRAAVEDVSGGGEVNHCF